MISRLLVILVFVCLGSTAKAQVYPWVDSIQAMIDGGEQDRFLHNMNRLSQYYWGVGEYDKAELYADSVITLTSLDQYSSDTDSLTILQRSWAYINLGSIWHYQTNLKKALEFYLEAEKIALFSTNKSLKARCLNNIGEVYRATHELDKALEYHKRALEIRISQGDPMSLVLAYMGIGTVHLDRKEYDQSLDFMQKAYHLVIDSGLTDQKCNVLIRLGVVSQEMGKYTKALEYLHEAKAEAEAINNGTYLAYIHLNIGTNFGLMGNSEGEIEQYKTAIAYADSMGLMNLQTEVRKELAEAYRAAGMLDLAYDQLDVFATLSDSLTRITQIKEIEAKYQSTVDSLKIEKLKAERDEQEIKALQEKTSADKERIQKYGLIGGISLMVVFAIFLFNRFRVTRKQRDLIELQKAEVDEKNKEIIDSIQYAKRIQSAVLPSPKFIAEHLKEHFVLYRPKDIVAGDFYWMEAQGEKIFLTAADCTGHGVPGAMVSVMCSNALSKAVKELNIHQPSRILDKTVELLEDRFAKSEEDVKDGMDLAFCSIDFQTNKLEYAGANNPLYYIRNGEIHVIKADKQPIGKFAMREPYTNHTLDVQPGDCFYLFSDGYPDQFGGKKGKKFKYKPFREMLLAHHQKPMLEQQKIFNEVFDAWKGELTQIDDVCVIGFRI